MMDILIKRWKLPSACKICLIYAS